MKMNFEEQLIELVREQDFLYNTKSKSYHNVLKRTLAWEEIAKILNRPVGEYKQRWRSLRYRFVKEKRAMEQPSGSGAAMPDRWEFYDALEFLIPSLTPRSQIGNFQQTSVGEIMRLPPTISPEVENLDISLDFDGADGPLPPKRARGTKRMAEEDFRKFLGGLNEAVTTHISKAPTTALSVDQEFMLNMAKRMEHLTEAVRLHLHNNIFELITQEVLQNIE